MYIFIFIGKLFSKIEGKIVRSFYFNFQYYVQFVKNAKNVITGFLISDSKNEILI